MTTSRVLVNLSVRRLSAAALSLMMLLATSMTASADEADAKQLLKAMSDYLAAQQAISFDYDAILEVVTKDEQILALASSGNVVLKRPDKIRATRSSGFADVEMSFDGKTLTLLGKNLNIYAQQDVPGTLDDLVDALRKHNRPLPAADLLLTDPYEVLMQDVVDVKDLGSGVIGGVECDYLAFRKKDVDWQIWIAQGERPYPCRYVISSKSMDGQPQYSIQVGDWKTGDEVAATDFSFKNPTDAKKVDLKDLEGADELPNHFQTGDAQ
ncbi:DUF2092 domain-containing protein [Allochromatium palmeri]|uniref:DUF2092 domain-containing protein n=1 Tax=Allochromatium palmeri TaxID=231048 RepID=A0A6N8E5W8_9GAMM|nr:DUF2092 domain-containing protein [Allochromatium palmeri]MTW19593.1 DUF2092 domain-containing protein [Allochromatium palmeri]